MCSLFVQVFFYIYRSVLPLEIPLSRGKGWVPIYWLNPDTFLGLSQARTWISNVSSLSFYFYVLWFEVRDDCSFLLILVELLTNTVKTYFHNYLPSTFFFLCNSPDHVMIVFRYGVKPSVSHRSLNYTVAPPPTPIRPDFRCTEIVKYYLIERMSPSEEANPLIKSLFHCCKGYLLRGKLL